jgi:hypothetical protein
MYVSDEVRTYTLNVGPCFVKVLRYCIGRGYLHGCEILGIPHCLYNRLTGGGEVSHKQPPRSTPQKHLEFLSLVLISVRG